MRPSHDELVYEPVRKKGRRGFRGYPAATIAFYGPDDERASKVAVAVIPEEGAEPTLLERFRTQTGDVRRDPVVGDAVLAFLRKHGILTVLLSGRIIGCPHEEGVDYPEGGKCPSCPWWHDKDRWTGETLGEGEEPGPDGPGSGEAV